MNIEQIAEELGLTKTKLRGDELTASCPLHDDRHPSFSINTDTGLWLCQSQCGGGALPELVRRVLDISRKEANAWLVAHGMSGMLRRGGARSAKANAKAKDKPQALPAL